MDRRPLGTTGEDVTEVGLGTWNIGGDWGDVSDEEGRDAIRAALDAGIDFLDTADVYGDGRSEQHIAHVLGERDVHEDDVTVATKAGRRLDPHVAADYDYEHLSSFVDRSREYFSMDTLDLLQLHCPPTETITRPRPSRPSIAWSRRGGWPTTASALSASRKPSRRSSTRTSRRSR